MRSGSPALSANGEFGWPTGSGHLPGAGSCHQRRGNGKPISFFQRNDASPGDLATNYGRLRQTITVAAGVIGEVRAVFWYQGESDDNDAARHVSGFTALLADWRREVGYRVRRWHPVLRLPGAQLAIAVTRRAARCGRPSGGCADTLA